MKISVYFSSIEPVFLLHSLLKTYGFLLAKVPFIPTHPYPLDIIQTILDVDLYPFYNEIKSIMGCPKKFVEFIKTFMDDFDKNHRLCKDWIESVHMKLMEKINNENSLLDLIYNNFNEDNQNKIQKKLL